MTYQVIIKSSAREKLRKLASGVRNELIEKIATLAEEPRPSGCKKLKGRYSQYRVRVRDYRIVHNIEDAMLTVLVINVGHRREIYDE